MTEYRGDDEEEELEEEEEIQPGDPDYDLSEAHGYSWEPERRDWPVPLNVLMVVAVIVVISLVLPTILIILINSD